MNIARSSGPDVTVKESGREVLLDGVRTARDRDVLVAGRRPCLLQSGLDPVGDKDERRAAPE
jgi:hypothetical protein